MALLRKKKDEDESSRLKGAIREQMGADVSDDEADVEDETRGVKQAKVFGKKPVLYTGEGGQTGDVADYGVLDEILKRSIKPVKFMDKVRLYWTYIVVGCFAVGFMILAFWDAFTVRGEITWVAGLSLAFPICIGIYIYAVEIRERVDRKYPIWVDVHNRNMFNYQDSGEKDGYKIIIPFKVYKQRIYVPNNPFGSGPLRVAIDTKCINPFDMGMITTGLLYYDFTDVVFRVDVDPDYIPNPDIHRLLFELSIANSKVKANHELLVEVESKYREMRKIKLEDELDELIRVINKLVPVMSLMLRSKEHELVSNVALFDALKGGGFDVDKMGSEEKERLRNAILKMQG